MFYVFVYVFHMIDKLRETFNQIFLGQMISSIICKLCYLIWSRVLSSYGVNQISSSILQVYNNREFSTQQLNLSSVQDKAIMEKKHYGRVLTAPEICTTVLLVCYSFEGSS